MSIPPYAELHCHSYYSLLDGASSPEALVEQAKHLGLTALALTDHDSLAGTVRFRMAAQAADLHSVIGAELTLENGHHLTLLAETQAGYANLCQLITQSRLAQLPEIISDEIVPEAWPGKIAPRLRWETLARHHQGLIALSGCRKGPILAPLQEGRLQEAERNAQQLTDLFGRDSLFFELQHHDLPDDEQLIEAAAALADRLGLLTVATNNVHYAHADDSRLRDVLIAINNLETLRQARQAGRLPLNHQYALASPQEMARRFHRHPDALHRSVEIATRCQTSQDFSNQRLPQFVPDDPSAPSSEFGYLYKLCHEGLSLRYPALRPQVLKQLAHELDVIEQAGLAGYFLVVWDIVRFAKSKRIRCQGRGSAANSVVAFLLGITNIDPIAHNLLFERFLSIDRYTTPDVDIDFDAGRREEVIQYIYERYGRRHAAMVCNTVTYRARSAIRDLGKVLAFPEPVLDRLVRTIDTHSPTAAAEQIEQLIPEDEQSSIGEHPLSLLADLMRRIDGCPRHLGIHSGGMVVTAQPLDQVVPLEPATAPGRIICQWDKDSIEDVGLIKIDILGLRTMGLITEAIQSIEAFDGQAPNLDEIGLDDPEIFAMLHRADTIGTFQVESRAQQQMLPRMKPTCFEEIAIQIAIIRPGPIQGGAVHPFLRRRAGVEPVAYLHESLRPVLEETMGVLLYQEQAIRAAVEVAGFSPSEADMLRRAMSRSRSEEAMDAMRSRFLAGAQQRGIDPDTANAIYDQLAAFSGYGFCKSHAASFALLAYQTLVLKRYYPAHFYMALLNNQPMGFYSSEVVAGDARRHGIDLLPVDISRSKWQYAIEMKKQRGSPALRIGFSAVHGLGEQAWQQIDAVRTERPFSNLNDFCRRTRIDKDVIANLIRAGAFDAFGSRRELLWALGDINDLPDTLALEWSTIPAELPPLPAIEQTAWEYELLGLSPEMQVMAHYRSWLRRHRVLSTWQVKHQATPGQRILVGGMVVIRQRPATAKGIMFISLEDESGLVDLVIKPRVYDRLRAILRGQSLLICSGIVQQADGVTSCLIHDAQPLPIDVG